MVATNACDHLSTMYQTAPLALRTWKSSWYIAALLVLSPALARDALVLREVSLHIAAVVALGDWRWTLVAVCRSGTRRYLA